MEFNSCSSKFQEIGIGYLQNSQLLTKINNMISYKNVGGIIYEKSLVLGTLLLGASAFGFELTSSGIENGYIKEKYGQYGTENIKGMPSLSLPLEWKGVPEGTKDFALVMQDYDAIPVTGFLGYIGLLLYQVAIQN